MKGLENPTRHEWPEILDKPNNGLKRILCILDDCTPAGTAVKEIIKVFEKHNRHDTIIIADDTLLVKLIKLQFDSQLRANRRYKVKDVVDRVKVLLMRISTDAVSFANAFKPDILVVHQDSLKHFQSLAKVEMVVIKSIK